MAHLRREDYPEHPWHLTPEGVRVGCWIDIGEWRDLGVGNGAGSRLITVSEPCIMYRSHVCPENLAVRRGWVQRD